jgi:hypothetical protein
LNNKIEPDHKVNMYVRVWIKTGIGFGFCSLEFFCFNALAWLISDPSHCIVILNEGYTWTFDSA